MNVNMGNMFRCRGYPGFECPRFTANKSGVCKRCLNRRELAGMPKPEPVERRPKPPRK